MGLMNGYFCFFYPLLDIGGEKIMNNRFLCCFVAPNSLLRCKLMELQKRNI